MAEAKELCFYVALDNGETHGLEDFNSNEKALFKAGVDNVETRYGEYHKIKDTSRVVPSHEASWYVRFGKWEGPKAVPIRFMRYSKGKG